MMDWNKILDEAESDEGFAALPEGRYPIKVTKAEATKAASSGANMLKVTTEVQGGPYDKRLLWTNIVFAIENPTAMKFTRRKLAALGVSSEYLRANNPTMEQLAKLLEGAEAEAEVTVRVWEGENRNDIKSFKATGGPASAGVTPPPPTPSADIPIPTPDVTPPTAAAAPDIEIPPPPPVDDEEPF